MRFLNFRHLNQIKTMQIAFFRTFIVVFERFLDIFSLFQSFHDQTYVFLKALYFSRGDALRACTQLYQMQTMGPLLYCGKSKKCLQYFSIKVPVFLLFNEKIQIIKFLPKICILSLILTNLDQIHRDQFKVTRISLKIQ